MVEKTAKKAADDDIYYKYRVNIYNSNDEFKNSIIIQAKYNRLRNSISYLSSDTYDDYSGSWRHADFSNIPETKNTMAVVPDSVGESSFNDVKKFYQDNKDFVNRYHQKLLPVRKKS